MGIFDDVMNGLEKKCYEREKKIRKDISKYTDEQVLRGMRNENNGPLIRSLFQDEAIKRGIY